MPTLPLLEHLPAPLGHSQTPKGMAMLKAPHQIARHSAHLYDSVPHGPVAGCVPQGGMSVMAAGQELWLGGVDGQSPELVSVTL